MSTFPDPLRVSLVPGGNVVRSTTDLARGSVAPSTEVPLWSYIRQSVAGISFEDYQDFIDLILKQTTVHRPNPAKGTPLPGSYDAAAAAADDIALPFIGVERYRLLKAATEVFLIRRVGALPDDVTPPQSNNPLPNLPTGNDSPAAHDLLGAAQKAEASSYGGSDVTASGKALLQDTDYLPYIRAVMRNLGIPVDRAVQNEIDATLHQRLTRPVFLELIWNYWHEEGMLVQSINAITLRFQNRRQPGGRDVLAGIDLDPLRPMSNLLWGYVQDLPHWLTIPRRAYEYDHQYGLRLEGRAVPPIDSADSRSQFIAAFHELLYRACQFYREDDNTIVKADAFPMLNALKDVHVILSEGAHNQYGDLPTTARAEMLMQMYLLARPEIREFLGGRPMVAYPEPWMDRVDSVKKMLGWGDVSVIQFNDLAEFGELLLLSIRYGAWIHEHKPDEAATWARYWRSEVQGYVHAYHAVTGVDLSAETTSVQDKALRDVLPSTLIRQRAEEGPRSEGLIGQGRGYDALPNNGNGNGNGYGAARNRRALPLPSRFGPR